MSDDKYEQAAKQAMIRAKAKFKPPWSMVYDHHLHIEISVAQAMREMASQQEHEFKNFHRSLCERFGYTHDDADWKRDQVSLEEHIAGTIDRLKAEVEGLKAELKQLKLLGTIFYGRPEEP